MTTRLFRMCVALAVALCCCTSAVAGSAAGPLFFVVASDTQKGDNNPFKDFRRAVEQINTLDADFVLMPGDLANTGSANQYENFMKVAREIVAPTWFAIGNHDANVKNLASALRKLLHSTIALPDLSESFLCGLNILLFRIIFDKTVTAILLYGDMF